jgi:MoxR-like ATPase
MSEFLQSDKVAVAKGALDRLRANMRLAILGKDDVIEQLLVCLAAGGHLLIEDLPGVGKTTLAYALARSTDCDFSSRPASSSSSAGRSSRTSSSPTRSTARRRRRSRRSLR